MTESNLDFSRSPDRAQILRKSLEHVLRLSQARAVRLSHAIDGLVQAAIAEGGVGHINIENLELGSILEELVADCELEAEAQGCRVELRSGGPLTVRGDRALLNKAFEHVLRNAICRVRPARRSRSRSSSHRSSGGRPYRSATTPWACRPER